MQSHRLFSLIVLNGTSSSGKTTLAHCLQQRLSRVWLSFSIDAVLYALPGDALRAMIAGENIDRPVYDYGRLVSGYHRAVAGLLQAGNRVIADNALHTPEEKAELKARVAPFATLWVGVHCDPDMLERREAERGDRAPGTARWEFERVHAGMDYDLTVDTTVTPATELAAVIAERVEG